MVIRSVREISPDERRALEHLLGEPLRDDQLVHISAFTPNVVPDEATRRAAAARLEQTLAKAEAYAKEHGITEQEADEAVEEAMQHVRRRRT